jgi:imidazolonepropionase-like amidohydrolase
VRYPHLDVERYANGTISPGLIDAHVHLTMPGDGTGYEPAAERAWAQRLTTAYINLRTHLEGGVTTVRDLGSHLDFLAWAPNEKLMLPRLLRYGPPITAPKGHMYHFGGEVGRPEESAALVVRNLRAGADGIKVVASGGTTLGAAPAHEVALETAILRAAANAAHDHGRLITAHSLSTESIRRATEAGTDGIEHLGFLAPDGQSLFDPEVADMAIAKKIVFGSTIGCNNRYSDRAARGELDPYELEEQREKTAYYVKNASRMRERGARIIAASDSGWKHTYFGDLTNELVLLQEAGYSSAEVLSMATGASAEALGIAHEVGSITTGLLADIVVYRGGLADDVARTSEVTAVYREGVRAYVKFI